MLWLLRIIINLLAWLFRDQPDDTVIPMSEFKLGPSENLGLEAEQYLAYITGSNGDDAC